MQDMTIKSVVAVPVLAFLAIGIASAGSQFSLATPVNLGTHKLKAGTYEVSLKKDQAVFTNEDGKSFTVSVKIEQADKKFSGTVAAVNTKNGADELTEIDLGGSTTKLMFGQ
jgi:hypothetical protein